MEKILLIGGGGHVRVLIDLIKKSEQYEIAGILDPQHKVGEKILGISVLGNDDLLPELFEKGIKNACIGVGSVKDNSKRKMIYENVKHIGCKVPTLIHPKAIVSDNINISEGVQIMAGAIIQTGSFIGENTIVNTGAIIDHDCSIGKHVHICPGVVISGGCKIGSGVFIGAGATVIHSIKIGKNSIVSASALVINDVDEKAIVKGVPAA
jgi:UDP-perosamine 4-acetyltransferase